MIGLDQLKLVVELARQNIIDDPDMADQKDEQLNACDVVEKSIADITEDLMKQPGTEDPVPETMPELREIRDMLITGRDNAMQVEKFDAAIAVTLSHMIAAINKGCIVQVKKY